MLRDHDHKIAEFHRGFIVGLFNSTTKPIPPIFNRQLQPVPKKSDSGATTIGAILDSFKAVGLTGRG